MYKSGAQQPQNKRQQQKRVSGNSLVEKEREKQEKPNNQTPHSLSPSLQVA
jgi:hypothetical protein